MQMIWLLGAAPPAKKVHFNLNGSELRGFPIKHRSGQSSILYANPLASKAVARFCLCPVVITGDRCCCLSKWETLMLLSALHPVKTSHHTCICLPNVLRSTSKSTSKSCTWQKDSRPTCHNHSDTNTDCHYTTNHKAGSSAGWKFDLDFKFHLKLG